jgi:hypothetical protein
MASLPELSDDLLIDDSWPAALPVWPSDESNTYPRDPTWLRVVVGVGDEVQRERDLLGLLELYPTSRGKVSLPRPIGEPGILARFNSPTGTGVEVLWKDGGAGMDAVADQYRLFGRRWLRPAVARDLEPPTPLMTWWALLFSLSMLARYHPVEWVRALDVDRSPIAVSLERAVAEALDAIPHLVLEGLLGSSLPQPPW